MALADEKYILLTTYRRSGEGVATPVWVVPISDGRVGFWTADGSGKTKRMRHTPTVSVQPCNASGKVLPGSAPIEGTAEMFKSGPAFDEVQRKVRAKYGLMVPISRFFGKIGGMRKRGQTYADTVVAVRLASS